VVTGDLDPLNSEAVEAWCSRQDNTHTDSSAIEEGGDPHH